MIRLKAFLQLVIIIFLIFISSKSIADEIYIAVASNFTATMKVIADEFEKYSGHKVILISGSTGKHYGQIINGAPFDLFFAADSKTPKLLVENNLAESRFTYAKGRLVLWSNIKNYVNKKDVIIKNSTINYLAMANPKFSPYGIATKEFLINANLLDNIQKKILLGQNVSQTYQFISSGNAKIGFVAYSQILNNEQKIKGSYWLVPENLYSPIKQQAVLLKKSDVATDFLNYIKTDKALNIIKNFGYETTNKK